MEALKSTAKVILDPKPVVEIEIFNEHNIFLAVHPYANTEVYWDEYFGGYNNVKAALRSHGIKVAFPKWEIL